jgi:flagellar biosynthesis protein FlhB
MADDRDESQKTEEPTEKRLREAAEKGNIPRTRELGTVLATAAAWLALGVTAPAAGRRVMETLLPLIENPDDIRLDGSAFDVLHGLRGLLGGVGIALLPALGLMLLGGVVSVFGQGRVMVVYDRIRPKFEHVSPVKGWRRMASRSALVEFAKNLAKMLVIAGIAWSVSRPLVGHVDALVGTSMGGAASTLHDALVRLLLAVLVATAAVAAVDSVWKFVEWRRGLRMSHQDLKEEFKQIEGDPHIKAKLREIRRARIRRTMMKAVPKATVVIANPTHYAVALDYERGRTAAPICLAKGTDLIALKIRSIAEENGVPVVENPPLARALYGVVEIDEAVPPEHYRAVAEVITFVLRVNGLRRPPPPASDAASEQS